MDPKNQTQKLNSCKLNFFNSASGVAQGYACRVSSEIAFAHFFYERNAKKYEIFDETKNVCEKCEIFA